MDEGVRLGSKITCTICVTLKGEFRLVYCNYTQLLLQNAFDFYQSGE